MISVLDIKILLRCYEIPMSKRDLSQFYKLYKKEERDKAIKNLAKHCLIEIKSMPKPNTKKTPTYFFITQLGKKWIAEYLEKFPRK